MDWFAPGGHAFAVRCRGATLSGGSTYDRVELKQRGAEPQVLELDEADRRYKPGFWRQDQTFLQCVEAGEPLPFPACDLDDAVKTMELIDQIAGTR